MDAAADEPVRIVPYDPRWPARFEREATLLQEAIGPWIVDRIHHIGSTAVPGLDAKPVIDIMVGVVDLEGSRQCFEPLARNGYQHAPFRAEEMHWFCKPRPGRRTHHLHLVPVDSAPYRDKLAFRDRLREDSRTAAAYAELKQELAGRFPRDREAYTDAKAAFIVSVLGRNR
jgi:GrpB-like predicted nucleotidyltransferase (UPF0157 family)